MLKTDSSMVSEQLKILMGRNLIKEMEPGKWVRSVLDKTTGKSFFEYENIGLSVSTVFF
jgi:hypothetical protein